MSFSFPRAAALYVHVLKRGVVVRCQAMIARHDDDKWLTDEGSVVHVMHLPFGTHEGQVDFYDLLACVAITDLIEGSDLGSAIRPHRAERLMGRTESATCRGQPLFAYPRYQAVPG